MNLTISFLYSQLQIKNYYLDSFANRGMKYSLLSSYLYFDFNREVSRSRFSYLKQFIAIQLVLSLLAKEKDLYGVFESLHL